VAYTVSIVERTGGYVSAVIVSSADADTIAQIQITAGDGFGPGWDGLSITSPVAVLSEIVVAFQPRNAPATVAQWFYQGVAEKSAGVLALQFQKAITAATATAQWSVQAFRPTARMKRR
jgi:hypothetical protein